MDSKLALTIVPKAINNYLDHIKTNAKSLIIFPENFKTITNLQQIYFDQLKQTSNSLDETFGNSISISSGLPNNTKLWTIKNLFNIQKLRSP